MERVWEFTLTFWGGLASELAVEEETAFCGIATA